MKAKEFAKWRKLQGLTQRQLAEVLGVDVMTVSRWERGVRGIPPHLPLALDSLKHQLTKRRKQEKDNGHLS